MVRKTKLFSLPKFGSLQTSASLKIGEILAIRKNLELGVALILRYLLTDLLLILSLATKAWVALGQSFHLC